VLRFLNLLFQLNPYPAKVVNMVSPNNVSKWQMRFNSAFKVSIGSSVQSSVHIMVVNSCTLLQSWNNSFLGTTLNWKPSVIEMLIRHKHTHTHTQNFSDLSNVLFPETNFDGEFMFFSNFLIITPDKRLHFSSMIEFRLGWKC